MKYSEANNRVKDWDTSIRYSEIFTLGKRCVILRRPGGTILSMEEGSQRVTVKYQPQRTVPYEAIKLLHDLNETPAKERRDEKKYYVKVIPDDSDSYLNYCFVDKTFMIADKNDDKEYQTKFTKKEVDEWLKAQGDIAIDWDKALVEVRE
ncbi:hypothetical protein [Lactiplantibacillus mudanjiangensis]|uniref:Uncharacterized protein n=1 Tax=Lactiplantibacillus mudanjiangensis TaxID=1296538 RepID=A0A660E5V6_9LACO|nr:hypothetical protein [Lactiplantibacillus mudanjiangensis]VDG24211.1 hypothetical protein MUDAN_IGPPGNFN_02480 [Lactiplantibacillus mudanjiangensis]VDG30189.1 hypothetical protein MUDAN_MDHGFNIF_01742 [Lactiplantibacillus mudanjiangensis]